MAFDPTPYDAITSLCENETVTQVSRDLVELPDGRGTVAVLTLHNDVDRRPETLGPRSLVALLTAIDDVRQLADDGRIVAVLFQGTEPTFAAGADLSLVAGLQGKNAPFEALGKLGHEFVAAIADLPVPSLARVNGSALGGGFELALAADYRISHPGVRNLGLPEIRIGLFPGWNGIFHLPRLIGPEAAETVIFENPLNNGRTLTSEQALEIGAVDALTTASVEDPESALAESLEWLAGVLAGETVVRRPHEVPLDRPVEADEAWERAVDAAQKTVARKTAGASEAAETALEIFRAGARQTQEESRALQEEKMVALIAGDQFAASVHAMLDLVQKRAKKPSMVPPATEPAAVSKVGVIGAGLMASQLALLFLTRLRVPVVISDVEQARVDHGLETVRAELDKLVSKGRLAGTERDELSALVSGTVDQADYADCDFVIEAVFEEVGVKKQVFGGLEQHVRPDCILATNTSSLLVTEMVADLEHPERVIGFHFFNPVAVMPLVEIVRTEQTTDQATATAFDLARRLGKVAVGAMDSSGFVVNRILGVVLSEAGRALDEGVPAETIGRAVRPLGLPMDSFTLIDLVGLPIAVHLLESLNRYQGERFHVSENFRRLAEQQVKPIADGRGGLSETATELLETGESSADAEAVRASLETALADEISSMLEEGVVPDRADIDLAMILGAGWPFFNGGITKYLDRVGAFDRAD